MNDELCGVSGCEEIATIKCGTWYFCTEHAVTLAGVTLNEDGLGSGNWGTAYAIDPAVVPIVRATQKEMVIRIPYQPAAAPFQKDEEC